MAVRNMQRIETNIQKKLCIKLAIYKDHTSMHGQQNIKLFVFLIAANQLILYSKIISVLSEIRTEHTDNSVVTCGVLQRWSLWRVLLPQGFTSKYINNAVCGHECMTCSKFSKRNCLGYLVLQ